MSKELFVKEKKQLSRTEKIRFLHHYLEPGNKVGLEIGPYVRPIVSRKRGFDVQYVESENTEELRKRAERERHDPMLVQDIDYVSTGSLLHDVGQEKSFDYVVSSHVIEHIPDLITHFQEVEHLLSDGGVYGLIAPDKMMTLDYMRPYSGLGAFVEAYVNKLTRPKLASYIDALRYASRNSDGRICWESGAELDLRLVHKNLHNDIHKIANSETLDSSWLGHSWVFSADSFLSVFFDFKALDLVNLDVVDFYPTGNTDFIVILAKGSSVYRAKSHDELLGELELLSYKSTCDFKYSRFGVQIPRL